MYDSVNVWPPVTQQNTLKWSCYQRKTVQTEKYCTHQWSTLEENWDFRVSCWKVTWTDCKNRKKKLQHRLLICWNPPMLNFNTAKTATVTHNAALSCKLWCNTHFKYKHTIYPFALAKQWQTASILCVRKTLPFLNNQSELLFTGRFNE